MFESKTRKHCLKKFYICVSLLLCTQNVLLASNQKTEVAAEQNSTNNDTFISPADAPASVPEPIPENETVEEEPTITPPKTITEPSYKDKSSRKKNGCIPQKISANR